MHEEEDSCRRQGNVCPEQGQEEPKHREVFPRVKRSMALHTGDPQVSQCHFEGGEGGVSQAAHGAHGRAETS